MARVLVVDDDVSMTEKLVNLLSEIGDLTVDVAHNQADALALMAKHGYQLSLVDIELGSAIRDKYAGMSLVTRLSDKGCTTLMVSGTDEDNLRGISVSLEAYDFISKPINNQDFLNKVQHALSVTGPDASPVTVSSWPEGLEEDPVNRTKLRWKGQKVNLTLTELSIVRTLVDPPDRLIDHRMLASSMVSAISKGALATHISNIRKKFRDIDHEFDRLYSEPGKGYYWKSRR